MRQCPACRRVFGEDNRCSACSAIAAVKPKGEGYACLACGAPRALKPGTVVLGPRGGDGAGVPVGPAAQRGISIGLRLFGIASIAGGILLAAGAAWLLPGTIGLVVAGALGLGGMGVGTGALVLGKSAADEAEARRQEVLGARIMDLAERGAGRLTATQVARELGLSEQEADAALTALTDGERVVLEISPDGVLFYDFREIRALEAVGPQVQVGVQVPAAEMEISAQDTDTLISNQREE